MIFRFLLALSVLALVGVGSASAQTANQVVTGYLSTSGCPSVATTPCFIQFGASGGGSGGAVTVADGADVNAGATTDAAAAAGGIGSMSAKLREATTLLNAIVTNTGAAIPAGAAIIGKVGIDQTTPGTTNAVAISQGGNTAAVTAPSTPPTAAQPALDVAISPNSITDGTLYSGTCSTSCNGTNLISVDTAGTSYSAIIVQTTAAGSGTLTAKQSNDGVTYTQILCYIPNSGNINSYPPLLSATNPTFVGTQICPIQQRYFELLFTGYSSGTFTAAAYGRTTPGLGVSIVNGQVGFPPYPTNWISPTGTANAAPITASATGTTAATAATLAGAANKTTYLCGFSIDANATAGASGNATITGTITGTLNFTQAVAATPLVASLPRVFSPCVPASAVNTGIVVNSIAAGTGGVVSVTAWGFQL